MKKKKSPRKRGFDSDSSPISLYPYHAGVFSKPIEVSGEIAEGCGEDAYLIHSDDKWTVMAVFDGCGGLGSRRYPSCGNQTGAYLASRLSADSLHGYLTENIQISFGDYLSKKLRNENERLNLLDSQPVIKSDMLCALPTTAAAAYLSGAECHIEWLGDSRVYSIDALGLHLLTSDDGSFERGELYTAERSLSGFCSGERDFTLFERTLIMHSPSLIFTATDGFYRAFRTPMELEEAVLCEFCEKAEADVSASLYSMLDEIADDDFTAVFCMAGFASDSVTAERERKKIFVQRYKAVKTANAVLYSNDDFDKAALKLWQRYKDGYYKYYAKD